LLKIDHIFILSFVNHDIFINSNMKFIKLKSYRNLCIVIFLYLITILTPLPNTISFIAILNLPVFIYKISEMNNVN